MSTSLNCFKTYDIRGRLGSEIDRDIVYRIARATAENCEASSVVIGFDARSTSLDLAKAAASGASDAGAKILDIGLAGTEEMYWAVTNFGACVGIEITASHNPIDYNGMKIVKSKSKPFENDEFLAIKALAEENKFKEIFERGLIKKIQFQARQKYIKKIVSFVDTKKLQPLKIVINSGNGAAGPTIDALETVLKNKGVKTNFIKVNHNPDSNFPNGIPNPLIEKNRLATTEAIIRESADFGIAFDGDFDRCFFFDSSGRFIPGEYIIGLLTEVFLRREAGATIIHDPRVIWNVVETIEGLGGKSRVSKTGHAFVKKEMREANAVYGGEISAHHYFRDFAYCDSGIIPFLIVWELLSNNTKSLENLFLRRRKRFLSSGEINFIVSDVSKCFRVVKNLFNDEAVDFDEVDGLSMSFEGWRFNIRKSNTEPLVRLNVETKGDETILVNKMEQLKKIFSSI
ncbi:phosphomannomutase [bacterium]|nr:phosphomannomutase [bacterium]